MKTLNLNELREQIADLNKKVSSKVEKDELENTRNEFKEELTMNCDKLQK